MTNEQALKYWRLKHYLSKDYWDDHWEAEKRHRHQLYVEAIEAAIAALEKVKSTADAQEIKHAHWILEKHLDLDILICSNCGCDRNCTKYGKYYMKHDKYCPNCGAKMDGGTNDESTT